MFPLSCVAFHRAIKMSLILGAIKYTQRNNLFDEFNFDSLIIAQSTPTTTNTRIKRIVFSTANILNNTFNNFFYIPPAMWFVSFRTRIAACQTSRALMNFVYGMLLQQQTKIPR